MQVVYEDAAGVCPVPWLLAMLQTSSGLSRRARHCEICHISEVTELDCRKALSDLLGARLDAQSTSAGRMFIRTSTASCCSDLQEIMAMFCTRACDWTTSVQCLTAAGCRESIFILVMLIFYLTEDKIHVLSLPELSCR